ncbi:MAG: PAS domain-containing sensor histidine kinase, partial [Candidatus Thorarchaeota archaeon]|nr:PAS domain-containing sensor histidine kinase [Candidatus Thorarchaeota archaeon]
SFTRMGFPSRRWKSLVSTILDDGHVELHIDEFACKDGTQIPVVFKMHRISDENGRPTCIWFIVRDISSQRKTELVQRVQLQVERRTAELEEIREKDRALKESEDRFKRIFNESPISMDVFDANGDFIHANEACLEMFGLSHEEALQGFNLFNDPNIPDSLKTKLRSGETVISDMPFDFDEVKKLGLYNTSKSGVQYLEAVLSPLGFDERGKPNGFISQTVDITEHKKAEEDLRRSESKYRNLVEGSLQGVAVVQKNRYIYVNPAFAKTVGYTVEKMLEFTPEEVWTCYHPDDREEQRRRHHALEVGLKFLPQQRFRYIRSDGSIQWVDSFARITEQYGEPAMQVVEINITEQKQAEESLQAAASNALFYLDLMGHDIRNHLQAIAMGTEILSHYELNPESTSIFDLIADSVDKSKSLINKILATRGFLSVPLTELSLKDVFEDSVNTLKETFDDFQIDIEYRVEHPLVRADDYLQHLLVNLLENGVIHNTKKVRQISVVLSEEEDGYAVSIADNGPGIPDGKKESLFDPNRRFGGVGLHQAMRIAQKYGGHIDIYDRVKNDTSQGTLFHLWLPKSATST